MSDSGRQIEAHTFVYDYGQLYIYDSGYRFSSEASEFLDALDDATQSALTVGLASGLVDVLMPRQENFSARLEVAITATVPPICDEADHIVEFDIVSSGRLTLAGSGGSGEIEIDVPPGPYRARLTGFAFDAAAAWSYADAGNPSDHYRLELWPTDQATPPAELRRWAGFAQ
jgi:hypothetical protein